MKVDGGDLLVNGKPAADLGPCISGRRNFVAVDLPVSRGARMHMLIDYSIVDGGNATRGTGFVGRLPLAFTGVEDLV